MKTVKTERLQNFEDNHLIGKLLICSATYIKNGSANRNIDRTALLENITICNTSTSIDHLWIKDTKIKATEVWKAKQHKVVYFIAKFIKITKAGSLYELKEDLNLKIIKIIK